MSGDSTTTHRLIRYGRMPTNLVMVIRFHTKKLAKVFNCEREIEKQYGAMSKIIRRRMVELSAADNLKEWGLPRRPGTLS